MSNNGWKALKFNVLITTVKLYWHTIFPPSPDQEIIDILEKNFTYYSALITPEKKRFENRLLLLLNFIEFKSSTSEPVTKEMKTIVAGALVQLTFGLKRYILKYFKTIIIQPGLYNIPELKEKLLGHVDKSKKTITLSWPNTSYGFQVSNDAHNVALHELAHVLLFENTMRLGFEEFFSRTNWTRWLERAEDEFIKNQSRKNILLSEYADRNLLEMFSVSVENFFEKADEFREVLPELYDSLVNLLKQDPANSSNPRGH
jgi:Mlc titration factor MtfA (ptsG expression regulator)